MVKRQGLLRSVEEVEFATVKWVAWYNTVRGFEPIRHVPPAEYEEVYYRSKQAPRILFGFN